jgi:ribonucleoside-triphosphate reductase
VQNKRDIRTEIRKLHKYQVAYRTLIQEYKDAGMLPVYNAGMISLEKQFLTIGINGLVEAAESQGLSVGNNPAYQQFVESYLKVIFEENRKARETYGFMFNTEFVPAENLGPKNARWDRKAGYDVSRECYNSYFFPVEDESINILDKFVLHGRQYNQYLDGGSALHLNLEEYPTREGFRKLLDVAASTGCNYFCFNVKVTVCRSCGHIDKRTLYRCPSCGSGEVDHATRVIGYLKKISSFSNVRQEEEGLRFYHKDRKHSEMA